MVFSCVCSKIKTILLTFIGIFRRALCCFSRKRTYSSENDEVLTGVNIHNQSTYSPKHNRHVERDWNSWDDSPRTVEEHIEKYREKLAKKSAPAAAVETQEVEPDYFGDMEPTTIRQAKYLIANPNAQPEEPDFSRLKATVEADIPISTELEDWNEDDPAGWDEITNENTKQLIREKRKEMRDQKQRQRERNPPGSTFLQAERLTGHR